MKTPQLHQLKPDSHENGNVLWEWFSAKDKKLVQFYCRLLSEVGGLCTVFRHAADADSMPPI